MLHINNTSVEDNGGRSVILFSAHYDAEIN